LFGSLRPTKTWYRTKKGAIAPPLREMRFAKAAGSEWVFPAVTKSGHMEPSTLKKQHAKAIVQATAILRKQTRRKDIVFQGFELYTLRHTCLTC